MTKQYNDPFYHVDYNAIVGGIKGDGVLSGLDVSERGAGQNMSVDVASGTAIIDETEYTESSTVNLSISAAHGTLPRRDIVIYDTATTNPSVITGTPATEPIPPNITSGDILLAVVNIAAGVTVITNSDIDDCRIFHKNHNDTHYYGGVDAIIYYDITSNDVLSNNATARSLTTSLTKEKETVLGHCADSLKISFTLYVYTSSPSMYVTAYGRIYRNGVAVGTQRSKANNGISGGHQETFTETISGWSDGDLLQIYGYYSGNSISTRRVEDLDILGVNIDIHKSVGNLTFNS